MSAPSVKANEMDGQARVVIVSYDLIAREDLGCLSLCHGVLGQYITRNIVAAEAIGHRSKCQAARHYGENAVVQAL